MTSPESIPSILITAWVIFVTVCIVVRRIEVGQRKMGWLLSMWICPAFATADLVLTNHGVKSRAIRNVLATITFLVSLIVWLALIQLIGFAVMSQGWIVMVIEGTLMFAPAFTAFLVWKRARRVNLQL